MGKYIIKTKYLWNGKDKEAAENKAILISDSKIEKVEDAERLIKENPSIEVIDSKEYLALPAFIDAHDHGRGVSPVAFGAFDRALEMWLQDLNKLPCIPHYAACYYDGLRLVSSGVGTVLHSHNPNSFANIRQEIVDSARLHV